MYMLFYTGGCRNAIMVTGIDSGKYCTCHVSHSCLIIGIKPKEWSVNLSLFNHFAQSYTSCTRHC